MHRHAAEQGVHGGHRRGGQSLGVSEARRAYALATLRLDPGEQRSHHGRAGGGVGGEELQPFDQHGHELGRRWQHGLGVSRAARRHVESAREGFAIQRVVGKQEVLVHGFARLEEPFHGPGLGAWRVRQRVEEEERRGGDALNDQRDDAEEGGGGCGQRAVFV